MPWKLGIENPLAWKINFHTLLAWLSELGEYQF